MVEENETENFFMFFFCFEPLKKFGWCMAIFVTLFSEIKIKNSNVLNIPPINLLSSLKK